MTEIKTKISYEDFRLHMIQDSMQDFKRYLDENIIINPYVGIGRKCALMDIFSTSFATVVQDLMTDGYSTLADIYTQYEMRKVFYIMFEYLSNVDFDNKYLNTIEYDCVITSGLFDYIMYDADNDYRRFCTDLDSVVGIRDFSILEMINKKLSINSLDDTEQMISLLENIDEKTIDKLSSIIEMNDPTTKKISEAVKASAYKEAGKKLEEEVKKADKKQAKNNVKKFVTEKNK